MFNSVTRRWKTVWEQHGYSIIACILLIVPFVAWISGFGRINPVDVKGNEEVARLITSISFPMTGILLFVLGQSLTYREKYSDEPRVERLVTAYTYIGVTSGITVVGSAIIGLLSLQYYKSGGNMLLVGALCFLLSILVLLVINTVSFCIYTMTDEGN